MGDAGGIPELASKDPPIGVDSCGIFMVGPDIEVKVQWGPSSIPILTAVAEPTLPAVAGDKADTAPRRVLHHYDRNHAPGQHWTCYKTSLPGDRKDLERSLRDLLTPATTQEDFDLIPRRAGSAGRPYCV